MNNGNVSVRIEKTEVQASKNPETIIPGTLPPDTPEQQNAYINEFAGLDDPLAPFIAASRFKAIHGKWPDKKPPTPNLDRVPLRWAQWLQSQQFRTKYDKHRLEVAWGKVNTTGVSHLELLRTESNKHGTQASVATTWVVVDTGLEVFSCQTSGEAIAYIQEHNLSPNCLFVSSDLARQAKKAKQAEAKLESQVTACEVGPVNVIASPGDALAGFMAQRRARKAVR